jgi:capsular exopolysaccharide synthesis family protein
MPETSSSLQATDQDGEDVTQRRTFRDYYIILRERVWIALPLAVLISVSYGYWKARAQPMYSATATMQFDKPATVVTTQGVMDAAVHSEFDINTYIQDLQSNKVRQLVVDGMTDEEKQVVLRPIVKGLPPGQAAPALNGGMLGYVIVEKVPSTFLIKITDQNADPDAAALIANRYVTTFMSYLVSYASGSNEYAVNYLKERADTLQKESEDAEARLEKYMKEKNLVSLDSSMNLVANTLLTVQKDLDEARINQIALNTVAKEIEDYRATNQHLIEIAYIAGHGRIAGMRGQLQELERQQAKLSETYLERHPKMIDIAAQIATVQGQLDQEISQAIADLKADVNAAADKVRDLTKQKDDAEKREFELLALKTDYSSLVTQRDVAKNNYMSILDRLNQTQTSKNLDNVPLHPLDTAAAPGGPYQPFVPGIIRSSLMIGALVFVGVAMGLSFIDDRIKSAWDVESFIGVNLLGIIPDLSAMSGEDKHSLVLNNQQTPGVEAFLGVYSAIKIQSKLDFPKSILVTSTIPGEGKTLVSSNLAGSFARHGKRTLLIDCDLRRPMLHRHFKQPNAVGLITWFEGGCTLDGPLSTNPTLGITKLSENFSILTSGGRSKSPTSMLEQPAFGQLIERLKKEFDIIVVDSPPMGAVTDALLIAERTDEIIYVCRFNRAYRKHIKLYIRALLSGKNAVLGIVLNGLSPRRIEYYSNYRYYRSYKKYYGSQT